MLFNAALLGEIGDKTIHGAVVRPADQRRRLTFLGDKPHLDEFLQVMRQGRGRRAQPALQLSHGYSLLAHLHKRTIDPEPGKISQGFELSCCVFEFHTH